ncbi:MAG: DedA family protein [Anaerolineae bacterium]|nr:DedA family protein [Anaerolineae bacterium]
MAAQDFEFLLTLGYLGVFLALYIEHVMPPLPTNLLLPVAGYMVGRGELDFMGVWLAACAGGLMGSLTLYGLGYWMGERPLWRYARWLKIPERRIQRGFVLSQEYGNSSVFAMHAMPISPIRVMVSIMAGVNRLSILRFLLASGIGNLIWIGAILGVTAFAGDQWGDMLDDLLKQQWWIIGISALLAVAFSVAVVLQFRSAPSES